MWILHFLPDFVFHLLLALGLAAVVASYFIRWLPFLAQYGLLLQISGILALAVGVYFEGGIANEAIWQARVQELEAKIAVAQQQSQLANKKLDAKLEENRKLSRAQSKTRIDYITREVAKNDSKCELSPEAIKAHNSAAGTLNESK